MALVVHPYIMGAPHRLKYFRKRLEHIREQPDVLFWTGEQILDWYLPPADRTQAARSLAATDLLAQCVHTHVEPSIQRASW